MKCEANDRATVGGNKTGDGKVPVRMAFAPDDGVRSRRDFR